MSNDWPMSESSPGLEAIAWYLLLNTGQQFLTHSDATQPSPELLLIPTGVEDNLQSYNNPLFPIALCMQASSRLRVVGARTSRVAAL
jgi:hypothetical protein